MPRPLIFLITCLFSLNGFAEPTPLVEKLMDTPASMFDVGMLKIQRSLDAWVDTNKYTISYDFKKNKFEVSRYILFDESKNKCIDEMTCKNFVKSEISKVRSNLCLDNVDENFDCELFTIVSDFSHNGYSIKNFYDGKSDSVAVRELVNIFYIEVVMFVKFNNIKKRITCARLLTARETFCTDAEEISKK